MVVNEAADDVHTPYTSSRDFRSDTVTTPTASMLAAMSQSSFGDDFYAEDTTTNEFERYVAKLLGHEAGLFVPSGTMGNQLGVRMHLMQPPHSVICDHRAHFRNDEAGAAAVISQAIIIPVVPSNGLHLTLEDIEENAVLDDDIHYAPTKVISIENTLGGIITPLTEVKRISTWARSKGLKMHLDGARIWNAVAAGEGSLVEFGREFDSVSVCFSKGLGAPIGSMLVATPASLIARARHHRKMLGGAMRQIGPIVNAARVALEENFPEQLVNTHKVARYIESALLNMGLKAVLPVQTSMLFVDLTSAGLEIEWLVEEAQKEGIRLAQGGRVVLHYQIDDDAVASLLRVFRTVLQKKADRELVTVASAKSKGAYGSSLAVRRGKRPGV